MIHVKRSTLGALVLAALSAATSRDAHAYTELATYDARSIGMGSAGLIENGAALYQNPAALDATQHLSATIVIAPVFAHGSAPLDQDYVALSSSAAAAVGLIGVNVRVFDKLVVGVAAFPTAASGSKIHDLAGDERSGTTSIYEVTAGASYAILPTLSLGAAWRIVHASEQVTNYLVDRGDLSGTSFVGAHVGLYWRPTPQLKMGLTYRSKVVVDVGGPVALSGIQTDITTQVASPHTFKAGAEWAVLENRLILAAGVGYFMYSNSNDVQTISGTILGQPTTLPVYERWHDSVAAVLGAEYWLTPNVPLRMGIGTAHSATPHDRPATFNVPPGWFKEIAVGTGLRLEHWDFDVGASYSFVGDTVDNPTQDPPTALGSGTTRYAGTYSLNLVTVSLTGTFHF